MKKAYVDYVTLIAVYGLSKEFSAYCKLHRKVSIRRNARNYLLKTGHYKELQDFRRVGFKPNGLADVIKICKTPWLDR